MLHEFQFSKLCLKHKDPKLNVNTPKTWLLSSAGGMVTQACAEASLRTADIVLKWLCFCSSLSVYPQGFQLALWGRCPQKELMVSLFIR